MLNSFKLRTPSLSKEENLLSPKDVELGFDVMDDINKVKDVVTEKEIIAFKKEGYTVTIKMINKLFDQSRGGPENLEREGDPCYEFRDIHV